MKRKYLKTGIFLGAFLLCAAIVCAAVRLFPLLRAAQTVRRVLDAESMEYEIHLTLNQEQFSEKQEQFLRAVSWVLETDESSCLSWEVSGVLTKGQGFGEIFCKGLEGAVTDVHFNQDDTWVNVRMIYEALQNNFTSAHPLLGNFLPDWKYSDYMSLEQIEDIFQIDIKGMFLPALPESSSGQSTWKYIMMLGQMEREKMADGGQQFTMDWKDYQVAVEIGKLGIFIMGEDVKGSQSIASYEAKIRACPAKEIAACTSVMTQEEIEQFMKLWVLVKGVRDQFGKER